MGYADISTESRKYWFVARQSFKFLTVEQKGQPRGNAIIFKPKVKVQVARKD